ncbi:MAG: ATP-binding protein [Prevotella sp.]|nr:ATP-binding protein [Prevotella sp.]
MKLENPFPEYGYFGSEYFCDREQETEELIEALTNGSNVTLMAPRRIGKTGLISHAFERMEASNKNIRCFYVDIFSTKTFNQMVQFIANAVIGKLDSPSQAVMRRLNGIVSALRPTLSQDPLTGLPTFSVSVTSERARETLQQVFEYMKESGRQCFLALDEFQQVSRYAEIGADAFIRSIIQFVPNVHIIFSGSQQHLLADMFMSPEHPFFNSSQIMTIGTIDAKVYRTFANGFFACQKRQMSEESFNYLYDMIDGQTWYIQKILNRLYRTPKGKLDQEDVLRAVDKILHEQEINYQSNYNLLTDNQAQLLAAIASEGKVIAPTSLDFIVGHHLPAPSSIKMALKSLQDKEFLFYDAKQGYMVYDRFFGMWLKKLSV